ncbi:MAG TPA: hypothetical protein VMM15_24595 [Bradyrhizobium sp.]|nr:hypothetical protein [Bradyrhizobium sp.]
MVAVSRVTVRAARIAARDGGLKVIKGNIGAAIFTFVPQGPAQKRDATKAPFEERFILFDGTMFTKRE